MYSKRQSMTGPRVEPCILGMRFFLPAAWDHRDVSGVCITWRRASWYGKYPLQLGVYRFHRILLTTQRNADKRERSGCVPKESDVSGCGSSPSAANNLKLPS